jgi:hypothetical protein
MSETTKPHADGMKKPGPTVVDTSTRTAREAAGQTGQIAQNAADRARDAGQNMSETVSETANAATNMSSKVADQGREVILMGMRTAADVGGRVADISFGRGHHLLASTVQAMDIYREASERSAERVHALMSSAMTLGRGLQQIQHAWLEMIDHSIENAVHKPQDMLRCKTLVELAEVQRDLYMDAVNHAFESSGRILELASRTAQDAVRSLQTTAR